MNKLPHLLVSSIVLCVLLSGCQSAEQTTANSSSIAPNGSKPAQTLNNSPQATQSPVIAPTATTAPQKISTPATKTEVNLPPDNPPVSLTTFDKLQTGMNYAEVAKILGSNGTTNGEVKIPNGAMKMYTWQGTGNGGEWNVTTRFDNGKLVNKVQTGLK